MTGRLIAVHPVVDVRDVGRSVAFFGELGFDLLFADDAEQPNYAGVVRDSVEVHLQWHSADEWRAMSGSAYRFLVDDPDALFAEFEQRGDLLPEGKQVADTAWGTREFGLYDPDGNALFFYRDLT